MKNLTKLFLFTILLFSLGSEAFGDDPGVVNTTYPVEDFLKLSSTIQNESCENYVKVVDLLTNGSWRESCKVDSATLLSNCVFGRDSFGKRSNSWSCYCYLTASCSDWIDKGKTEIWKTSKKRIDDCNRSDLMNCKGKLKCEKKGHKC